MKDIRTRTGARRPLGGPDDPRSEGVSSAGRSAGFAGLLASGFLASGFLASGFLASGFLASGLLIGGTLGCRPQRVLKIDSIPPGATVRLDEKVIGRTPIEYDFEHYGTRRLSLYLPGYRTHSERFELDAPWHARFPVDVVFEVLLPLGLDFEQVVRVPLVPDDGQEVAPVAASFVEEARTVRAEARAEAAAAVASGASGEVGASGEAGASATPGAAAEAAPTGGVPRE